MMAKDAYAESMKNIENSYFMKAIMDSTAKGEFSTKVHRIQSADLILLKKIGYKVEYTSFGDNYIISWEMAK